jgi:hypothetical protein
MKKYILSIAFILISLLSFSQPSEYHCYKTRLGIWDKDNGKWIFEEPKASTLTLVFNKKIITINNEARSRYESISDVRQEETSEFSRSSWDGVDEKGRKIVMQLVKYHNTNELVYMVIYDQLLFVYFINKSGLSPFN